MKKLILAIFLFITSLSFSQEAKNGWILSTTIDTTGAGLTGSAILLPSGAVPVAVWVDTLTAASTISFDVLFGAVTQDSTTSGESWRTLTKVDSGGTNYAAVLTDDKITPLNASVVMALLGRSDAYPQQTVWIKPLLSAKQADIITIYIRVRYI